MKTDLQLRLTLLDTRTRSAKAGPPSYARWAALALLIMFAAIGCSSSSSEPSAECSADGDCPNGACISGMCTAPSCATIECRGTCCEADERCTDSGCALDLGPCTDNDDCQNDSYCTDDRCTPYGTPPERINDPLCERRIEVATFEPSVQCQWTGEDAALPGWSNVYSAPMVADFDLDNDREVLAPSIVFTSFQSAAQGGVLRIVDGRTCRTLFTLDAPADRLVYASNLAIGDIDSDGSRPEIVGISLPSSGSAGGLVAFAWNGTEFARRWYGRRCDLEGEPRHIVGDHLNNNGPSMHDLDDDGVPEIAFGRYVYDSSGCVLNPDQPYDNYLRLGTFSVISDVDDDGDPELVYPDGIYRWSDGDWILEDYWTPEDPAQANRFGHVAVADLGNFAEGDPDAPEIVVVSAPTSNSPNTATGSVRVMTLTGKLVFGPFTIPADDSQIAGRGGPPTIGDFDGDGRREFAIAGASRYTVFDPDCDIDDLAGAGCQRENPSPRGVLWSMPTRDFSSNVTGSSVFDFDADGLAEVVYGDECYLRIYRGTDGTVLFSTSASSGTGYEYPVIADVDGDFSTEILVAMTRSGVAASCPATDPTFTTGTSTFTESFGVLVLRDALDRWAASRPIWNQHAYNVTNVEADGTIPRTSAWTPNHDVPELNNFRMNTQGMLSARGIGDLTVRLSDDMCDAAPITELSAIACNRGTNPVPDGVGVTFYAGDPDDGAEVTCTATLPTQLGVGECSSVSCAFTPANVNVDTITVLVDPQDAVVECSDRNNRGGPLTLICN